MAVRIPCDRPPRLRGADAITGRSYGLLTAQAGPAAPKWVGPRRGTRADPGHRRCGFHRLVRSWRCSVTPVTRWPGSIRCIRRPIASRTSPMASCSATSGTRTWSPPRCAASMSWSTTRPWSAWASTWATCPSTCRANDLGTAVLLAGMARAGVGRLVLASSMVVYGEGAYDCATHGRVRPAARTTAALERGPVRSRLPRLWMPAAQRPGRRGRSARPAQRLRGDQARPGAPGRRLGPVDRRRGHRPALPQRLRARDAAGHAVLRGGRDLPVRAGGSRVAARVRGRRPATRLRPRHRRRPGQRQGRGRPGRRCDRGRHLPPVQHRLR